MVPIKKEFKDGKVLLTIAWANPIEISFKPIEAAELATDTLALLAQNSVLPVDTEKMLRQIFAPLDSAEEIPISVEKSAKKSAKTKNEDKP